uniref:Calmodulin regulated spectrin-associated protein 1b n=1 Tax=Oncorhynchus mykiss TaxID=8022 RepID=A0A8C7S990_ONCMY
MYDSARAKIDANLRWLFAKAYSIDHIPEDLRDPFYTDQYDQEHIKPPVLQLLLSCELYCRVCALILKADQAASLQSHMSVIQALSRKGIYVMESDDAPVRDADLSCVPIKMSAHMPMIDALMMAYTVEMISIEKVVACVKRFSTFSASKELPFDLEDAMVFWINKVNLKMREITERELKVKQHPLESPSHQKVRYRRENTLGRQLPFFPLLEDLMRDVCDGAALLTVVHYYCPDHMKLHDICLKEVTSIADSLYNIQLLKQFSNEYLNKSFYLTMEDMLYSPLVLKHNVMVFIAELFWWFETVKPEFVQPRMEEFRDAMAQPKSARPSVPISNATKRSFQVTPGIPEASLSVSAQSSPDGRYSLYPAEGSDPLPRKTFDEEEESAKLMEDLKVKEKRDKDKGDDCSSGRSSPCLSTHSQASSLASGSVRMTSFAERKAQQRFGSNQDLRTSASSSQRTTPDGSECSGPLSLPTSRRLKMDQSPSMLQGGRGDLGTNMLASELVQLHMQLEEKRKAIEHQKKKMEMLSARQRQKLGKAAFLHIVKKGKSDTLGATETESATSPVPDALETVDKKGSCSPGLLLDEELDLDECNRSIEMLNDAIGSIQQQMMQLSLQQDLLMKQNVQSPPRVPSPCSVNEKTSGSEPKARPAVHFVDLGSGAPTTGTAPSRKPPKLSSARGPRTKLSELKLAKEHGRPGLASSRAITPPHSLETLPHLRQFPGGRSPRADHPDVSSKTPSAGGETISGQDKPGRRATFRLHDEANLRTAAHIEPVVVTPEVSFEPCLSSTLREGELNSSDGSGKENIPLEEVSRSKAPLIEVDLSDLKDPEEMEGDGGQDSTMDGEEGEQKSGLGFFFKDEQKAEDELAKKRAAFLVRQQKKAEETRLRKMQLEAETEQKREEARRKAEEDRMRKEEEKARRELIKEQYLRRKQQELMEEQGLGSPAKPKTAKTKPKKLSHQTHRPKSAFSREEISSDTFSSKGSSSTLPGSQRGESVESFPGLSRNASRNTDRDWDNGSTASSITSMAEYTGPKLFREPSSKSNKPIIFNAISHCCLAGKVNEPQKNTLLEELERVDAHHLMILFRDGGCQFRGVYSYFPDTEEILKLTGTGPKSISKKMIDKLYKYSSDRKQFTVIPAKTVSVSIDAITIHNHLWQAKRTTVPKKSGK